MRTTKFLAKLHYRQGSKSANATGAWLAVVMGMIPALGGFPLSQEESHE
jgi:hypothetical protein